MALTLEAEQKLEAAGVIGFYKQSEKGMARSLP